VGLLCERGEEWEWGSFRHYCEYRISVSLVGFCGRRRVCAGLARVKCGFPELRRRAKNRIYVSPLLASRGLFENRRTGNQQLTDAAFSNSRVFTGNGKMTNCVNCGKITGAAKDAGERQFSPLLKTLKSDKKRRPSPKYPKR
jgi:hypothetical protein